jgi:hypothetical protein
MAADAIRPIADRCSDKASTVGPIRIHDLSIPIMQADAARWPRWAQLDD